MTTQPNSFGHLLTGFGAISDAREVRDAAMTSDSAVLTSAAADFTSADVGKPISVEGAGPSGGILRTTIIGWVSATEVTLGAPSLTTISAKGAVWGTDCGPAFQGALDTLVAKGGGTLVIDGDFFLTTPVAKHLAGVTINIVGTGTDCGIWISLPIDQDAFALIAGFARFSDVAFVGNFSLTRDCRRHFMLTNMETAFERCQFQGLAGADAVIYSIGGALRTKLCTFGGCGVFTGVDGPAYAPVEHHNWFEVEDDNSSFIDYGAFRGLPYSRLGQTVNRAWVRVANPAAPGGARGHRVVRLRNSQFDEGSAYGVEVLSTGERIHAVELDGIRVNVTPFGYGRSAHIVNADRVLMRNCLAGFSATPNARVAHFENCTNVTVEGQEVEKAVSRITALDVGSLKIVDPPAGLTTLQLTSTKYIPVNSRYGALALVKAGPVTDADFLAPPAPGTQAVDTLNGRLYVRGSGDWFYFSMDGGSLSGPNLITNGDFANGTTGWVAANNAQLSVVGGKLRITNPVAWAFAYQSIATVIGQSYQLTWTASSARGMVMVGTGPDGHHNGRILNELTGSFTFTATATATFIGLYVIADSAASIDYDDISLRAI